MKKLINKIGKKNLLQIALFILFGFGAILIGKFTDITICVFYRNFGIPCPSCGMTRAFTSLMKLDIRQAFMYHPLFLLVFTIPFLIIKPKRKYIWIIAALFIGIWLIRLAIYFPHTEPMIINYDAPFIKFLMKLGIR